MSDFVVTGDDFDSPTITAGDCYLRSPYQAALLQTATMGMYSLYWLTRNAWHARRRLGKENTPVFKYRLCGQLLIPGYNVVLALRWYASILRKVHFEVKGRHTGAWIFCALLTPVLSIATIPAMQAYVYDADLTALKNTVRPKFSRFSLSLVIFGFCAQFFGCIALAGLYGNDSRAEFASFCLGFSFVFPLYCLTMVLPFRPVTARIEERLLREFSTSCPECLLTTPKAVPRCRYCDSLLTAAPPEPEIREARTATTAG